MLSWTDYIREFCRPMRDLVDLGVLQGARIMIFGAGAVGLFLIDALARMFVGGLTIWDVDKVSISNIARSVYDLGDLSLPKDEAAAKRVKHINPLARVVPIRGDLLKAPHDMVVQLVSGHDVVVVAADDFAVHRRLNQLLWGVKECVYSYVTDSGDTGEIMWTSPGEPGCIECLINADERSSAGVATDFQALAPDMFRVALDASCVVLGLLLRGAKGGEMFGDFVNPSSRLLCVFNRRRGIFAESVSADVVCGTVQVDTRSSSTSCPVCGRSRRM